MPNRMLRDWTRSEKIKLISVNAERFFTRLIMKVDDHGCLYADATLLKADLFPYLMNTIREADLLRWMAECHKAGLIVLYENSGKRYIHIIDFRQRLDKARSKYPLPKSTDFPDIVNEVPAEREREREREVEEETEKKKKIDGPGGPPTEKVVKDKNGNFIPPVLQPVITYFLSTVGDTKKNNPWPADKCKNEAGAFLDHYIANGWVQGRNKPIRDWQAAARQWIRNDMKGKFDPPVPTKKTEKSASSPAKPPELESKLDKRALEINFLYERFQENQCTVISLEVANYDFLKMTGRISFSDEQVAAIKAAAEQHMRQFSIDATEKNALFWMKKFGVLEYFKEMKVNNKTTVYEE